MAGYRGIELQYECDLGRLPGVLAEAFVSLGVDESTRTFIDHALEHPQSRATTALRDVVKQVVGYYDANGLTGAFPMRVLGTDQWRTLVGRGGARLLDVGAGDGNVTAQVAPLYEEVVTTELSSPMASRLRKRGFACHEVDVATGVFPDRHPFDAVALLNVLDRTTFPLTLLRRLPELMAEGASLVVAIPMPLTQVVLDAPRSLEPLEPLPSAVDGWERGVAALWEQTFSPLGYWLRALSRVPYLCHGDSRQPVEVLDDAVFVLGRG